MRIQLPVPIYTLKLVTLLEPGKKGRESGMEGEVLRSRRTASLYSTPLKIRLIGGESPREFGRKLRMPLASVCVPIIKD